MPLLGLRRAKGCTTSGAAAGREQRLRREGSASRLRVEWGTALSCTGVGVGQQH